MRIIKRVAVLGILMIICLGVYATFIERTLLISKEYNITLNQSGKKNLRIVQFTDSQLGEFYSLDELQKAVDKINSLKPDIVVFTGDLIDNASLYGDISNVSKVLGQIRATSGKFAIYGNHDYGGGAVKYYHDIMSKSGFTVLKNDSKTINFEGKNISIFGADDYLMGNPSVEKTMSGINPNNINILLVHEPDVIDKYSKYPIDIALAGHSHGGQVYIPFYGAVVKNVLAKKYTKGFYQLDNERKTKIYVNSGLGNTKLPFRFGNIPQVSLFNIKF